MVRLLHRWFGLWLLLVAPALQAEWFSQEQAIMGTSVSVTLWHKDAQQAEAAITAVMAEMHRINATMSPWIASSELAIVNLQAASQPVVVSDELYQLVAQAQQISALSDGAFDITFASIGHRYNYRAQQRPDAETLIRERGLVDYRNLRLDPEQHSVQFAREGMKIDLGGIAKGHAVERGVAILREMGIAHAIVTAGGDSRLLGDKQGKPWLVGIRNPRDAGAQAVMLPLADEAISTSGDYERFFEQDGVRYHHILDPKSGDSARAVHSASVIGPDATLTDALSTTVFVLGVDKGLQLIDSLPDYEAVIIDNQQKLFFSRGLRQ